MHRSHGQQVIRIPIAETITAAAAATLGGLQAVFAAIPRSRHRVRESDIPKHEERARRESMEHRMMTDMSIFLG